MNKERWLEIYEETKPLNDNTPFFRLLEMMDGSMVVVEDKGAIWKPGSRLLGVNYDACHGIYIISDIVTGIEICADKCCPYGNPDIAYNRMMSSLVFGNEINKKMNAEWKKRCVQLISQAYNEHPEIKRQVFGEVEHG